MRYIPIYFKASELVSNLTYELYKEDSLYLMDDRILWTLDSLKKYFKVPITVNNWKTGGQFSQRGYRDDVNTGAKFSAHRYGRAADFNVQGITSEQFRQMVRDGKLDIQLKYINRIEDKVNWVHLDCIGLPRSQGQKIEFINP